MYDFTDGNEFSLDFDTVCNGMDHSSDLDIYDDINVKMNASDLQEAEADLVA